MLNPLSVCYLGYLGWDAERQQVDHEPVTGSHPFRQRLSGFRQKHPDRGDPVASCSRFKRDRLDSGGVQNA